jgi:hypothetical protein
VELLPCLATPVELWPPSNTPEPNLYARGLTEGRCVFEYHHARTSEQKLDALQHLVNICLMKVNRVGAFWLPRPALRFVDARTARRDWENVSPGVSQKHATRGWFQTNLPELISKYSPQHVTRRELLGLIQIRDGALLHICNALTCDLLNESAKQARHNLNCTSLWAHRGANFYFDAKLETEVQANHSATILPAPPSPDYKAAIQMLVRDKELRATLPNSVCRTLELVFRKLDSGVEAQRIIAEVAGDIKKDERTVRRHLETAHRIATDVENASHQIVQVLASVLLPSNERTYRDSTPSRPTVDVLAER